MKQIPSNLTAKELERWAYAENDQRTLLALAHTDGANRLVERHASARQQDLLPLSGTAPSKP